MQELTIGHLAHDLKENKRQKKPGAIVLIGAGCSYSAGIPTSKEIIRKIFTDFGKDPMLKGRDFERCDYHEVMSLLSPMKRNEIFRSYVEASKINVSYIYLANLLRLNFVDYVLTVNFDDLILKALALYNIFPPIYDLSILREHTTTSFEKGSVTFLHGRHNGVWFANTDDEQKTKLSHEAIRSVINKISHNRTWIVIGYSGHDYIFDDLLTLGRFDNRLYWICYGSEDPLDKVIKELIDVKNMEAYIVKGFNSDTFFLKLNSELKCDQPFILNKPFTYLSKIISNVKDIENSGDFKFYSDRLNNSRKMIDSAINIFETGSRYLNNKETERLKFSNKIINSRITEDYEELERLSKSAKYKKFNKELGYAFNNWGMNLTKEANMSIGEKKREYLQNAIEKFSLAARFHELSSQIMSNWGTALGEIAILDSETGNFDTFKDAFEKFRTAINLSQNSAETILRLATYLSVFARRTKDYDKKKELYKEAFSLYKKAVKTDNENFTLHYNWGNDLAGYAGELSGKKRERFLRLAFEKYEKALSLKPDHYKAYNNFGTYISLLALMKKGKEKEELFKRAFVQYENAILYEPTYFEAYYSWGTDLSKFAETKQGKQATMLLLEAEQKCRTAQKLGSKCYNLSCILALLNKEKEAFKFLKLALLKREIDFDFVERDSDWDSYRHNKTYLSLKAKQGKAKAEIMK